jgi:hypothetical protein
MIDPNQPEIHIVGQAELSDAQLEPSERFASLLKRVAGQTRVGGLGLDAIRESVRERAGGG